MATLARPRPLRHIASIDCAALPRIPDLPLPVDGTLLFFYFDGQSDNGEALVYFGDLPSQAGARVIYIPVGTDVAATPCPDGISPYPQVAIRAKIVDTTASYEHFSMQIRISITSDRMPGEICGGHRIPDAIS